MSYRGLRKSLIVLALYAPYKKIIFPKIYKGVGNKFVYVVKKHIRRHKFPESCPREKLGLRLVVNRRLGCKFGTLFWDFVVNRRHNGILDVNRGPFIIEFSWILSCIVLRRNKITIFICKYISIRTIPNVMIPLILAFRYDIRWVHGGSNSWEKRTASGTKMEQWSVIPLPIGRPRAVDKMASLFWRWHFENKACVYWAASRN